MGAYNIENLESFWLHFIWMLTLTHLIQLLNEVTNTKITTVNEKIGVTVNQKWIFEIFHGEFLNGINQILKDSSGDSVTTHIGCDDGNKTTIILSDGEKVTTVEFSGFDLTQRQSLAMNYGFQWVNFQPVSTRYLITTRGLILLKLWIPEKSTYGSAKTKTQNIISNR